MVFIVPSSASCARSKPAAQHTDGHTARATHILCGWPAKTAYASSGFTGATSAAASCAAPASVEAPPPPPLAPNTLPHRLGDGDASKSRLPRLLKHAPLRALLLRAGDTPGAGGGSRSRRGAQILTDGDGGPGVSADDGRASGARRPPTGEGADGGGRAAAQVCRALAGGAAAIAAIRALSCSAVCCGWPLSTAKCRKVRDGCTSAAASAAPSACACVVNSAPLAAGSLSADGTKESEPNIALAA